MLNHELVVKCSISVHENKQVCSCFQLVISLPPMHSTCSAFHLQAPCVLEPGLVRLSNGRQIFAKLCTRENYTNTVGVNSSLPVYLFISK